MASLNQPEAILSVPVAQESQLHREGTRAKERPVPHLSSPHKESVSMQFSKEDGTVVLGQAW